MYNLILGAVDGVLRAERLLEGLDQALESYFRPGGVPDTQRLLDLPTLLMPEVGDTGSKQVAQIGSVASLSRSGRDYRFRFIRNDSVPEIPSNLIQAAASHLGIGTFSFSRTNWTVKSGDLYQILFANNLLGISRPKIFTGPTPQSEPDLISVMMPFSAEFDGVWESLKSLAAAEGWRCQRADDIWLHSAVIDDIFGLIARSRVVVCDLTNRNPNVFYEAGIAHTLGREVIFIAQSESDVPFDLRHHRYLPYLRNEEGLSALRASLSPRLRTLMR